MAEDNDNKGGDGDGGTKPSTIEELQAQLSAATESITKLTDAHRKTSAEAKKLREREDARETERKRLEREGLSEPDKIAQRAREAEQGKAESDRLLAEERQARVDDANERIVLTLAPKFLNADHVDLAFGKIDRSLLIFGEDGKITAGVDKALEKLAKERPTWGSKKPTNNGTGNGHIQIARSQDGGPKTPFEAMQDRGKKTS